MEHPFANLMDYLTWRGDLSMAAAPWNEVDILACAAFCYIELDERAAGENSITIREIIPTLTFNTQKEVTFLQRRNKMALSMPDTVRFGNVQIHHFINQINENTQFSAMILDFPDGPRVVAFRGTDATLAGWKEDCCMSYETVPSQTLAQAYLRRVVLTTPHEREIIVCGHSKGGNLSAYAAAHLPPDDQDRLTAIYSFDGPGLDDETIASIGYARIQNKLFSVVPQGSIVGLMMGYQPKYTVVHSNAFGIMQHDCFTWELNGPAFAVLEKNDRPSRVLDDTTHEWLKKSTPEQRRIFVSYLFDVLSYGNASTTADLKANILKTLGNITEATIKLDPEGRKVFQQMLGLFISSGTSNAFGAVADASSSLLQKLPNVKDVKEAIQEKLPKLPEKKRVYIIQGEDK